MTTDVQGSEPLPEPAELLLETTRRVAPGWLRRVAKAAAARGGVVVDDDELNGVVDAAVAALLVELDALLMTDVDEQTVNPLSLFRDAVAPVTGFLRRHEVPRPPLDPFTAERFPDDVYGMGPAAWSDVDPELHEPGITWGAWKAMTVLRRRREEGMR